MTPAPSPSARKGNGRTTHTLPIASLSPALHGAPPEWSPIAAAHHAAAPSTPSPTAASSHRRATRRTRRARAVRRLNRLLARPWLRLPGPQAGVTAAWPDGRACAERQREAQTGTRWCRCPSCCLRADLRDLHGAHTLSPPRFQRIGRPPQRIRRPRNVLGPGPQLPPPFIAVDVP